MTTGGGPNGGVAAADAGGTAGPAGRDTGAVVGRSGANGVAGVSGTTAGTGSMATRGGGSGISSGTVIADLAGFDAHAPASKEAANAAARVAGLITNP